MQTSGRSCRTGIAVTAGPRCGGRKCVDRVRPWRVDRDLDRLGLLRNLNKTVCADARAPGLPAPFFVKSCELRAVSYELRVLASRLGLYSREMDRRTFLAASAAVLGHRLVGPAEMLAMAVDAAPVNLLGLTFGPLASSL